MRTRTSLLALFGSTFVGITVAAGCGSSGSGSEFKPDGGGSTAGSTAGSTSGSTAGTTSGTSGPEFGDGGTVTPCEGLQCQQVACDNGGTTSLSGTVLDPSGTVPLYNAIVYVPNAPLDAMTHGASCDRCGTAPSGKPVATALTDSAGHFTLKNVPVADNIPVVIQIGKWRRQITVPAVTKCGDTALGAADTRLPRTKAEGDMPKIALATGSQDSMECFVKKLLGDSTAEITNPSGSGMVHLFQGGRRDVQWQSRASSGSPWNNVAANSCTLGSNCRTQPVNDLGGKIDGSTPHVTDLWGASSSIVMGGATTSPAGDNTVTFAQHAATLTSYDMVILSCEGGEYMNTKDASALQAMNTYLDAGGRVFASHWHRGWFRNNPTTQIANVASWVDLADPSNRDLTIDTTFPKGVAFADWLVNVNASTTRELLPSTFLQKTVTTVSTDGRRWIYDAADANAVKFFSFNTPIAAAADAQCGRAVNTDIHISGAPGGEQTFPSYCSTSGFTAQEKALLFLMMDLSSCVQDETKPPEPPPVIR